jgi:RimJ/RimL family protein N-acetyltransferase
MLIHTPHLRLMTMESVHLAAIVRDPVSLGELLGVAIPKDWPAYPAAYPHALALIKKEPLRSSSGWWLYQFMDPADKVLVGCGGFKDAPDQNGVVDIGCEIAPALRGRGFATEAMFGLINYACTRPEVRAIDAYSQAQTGSQSSLLQAVGMTRIGEALDNDGNIAWHWRVTSDAFVAARRASQVLH